ncbi:nitrogenase component 1 [Pectinatus frisingensis]|uniref:nitrogenase component 1 n=1 Tax=Pectinatus frisingensis TaxID=865 RepID=UPI0018C47A74|nr:nitrogenase component 1 [Pectinatus frisingensis]
MSGKWDDICNSIDTCALAGAAAFFAGIPKAQILANGQLWCYFYALRYLEHAEYNMAERFHCTQTDNNAVIYGTEEFLLKALERMQQSECQPSILLVENSCSISLIGDDIAGIAGKAALECPVVAMDCGGLLGGFAEGYAKAGVKLLQVLPLAVRKPVHKKINLLGLTDFYYNGAADSREIVRILHDAGYLIGAIPGGGSTLECITGLTDAELNVVINEELGLPLARFLKQQYDMPYVIAGVPYGVIGSKKWLSRITQIVSTDAKAVFIECDAAEKKLTAYGNDVSCNWGEPWFDETIICAPGTMALCMAEAVRGEWINTQRLQVVCRDNVISEDLYSVMADKVYPKEKIKTALESVLCGGKSILLAGSSNETAIFMRHNKMVSCCNVAYPVNDEVLLTQVPFAGIRGSFHMQQRLWNAFIKNSITTSF